MKTFNNMSTRAKLTLGFGFMVLLLVLVSALAWRSFDQLTQSRTLLFRQDAGAAYDLMRLRNVISRERTIMLALALDDGSQRETFLRQLQQESNQIAGLSIRLTKMLANEANFARDLERLARARSEYETVRDREVLPLLKAGRTNEAVPLIVGPLREKYFALRDVCEEMGDYQLALAEQRMDDADVLTERARWVLLLANVIAILAGIGMVIWLSRTIAKPLLEVTGLAKRIAQGDLTVSVPDFGYRDEVGHLQAALKDMVEGWKAKIKELEEGIATLGSAASEILAGTMQSASGASETAAAVSETTATVEEVKQTALLASQKARSVSDAAQKATQTAENGRNAVEGSVEAMENVQRQMELIADTIVRLSERSQAIAEITESVGGLADQSNLLAVNAAIEAAKAGEHGKGFAVVAQEVKDLAEQSRQATRQVRQILGEIQKSVSAAVMATEQGARAASGSLEQATQAGEVIRALAAGIADAAMAAAQISASSQQQLAGMDQVAAAMESIKQVSAEHAASTRQAEASAQNLHELGQKLSALSASFKL